MPVGDAKRIRKYAIAAYIKPARRRGDKTVTIRAGDVHSDMGLVQSMPNVCSSIRGPRFEEAAQVRLTKKKTPPSGQGANAYYTFALDG